MARAPQLRVPFDASGAVVSMLRGYDDWKAGGPHEDMPSARPVIKTETCEHCGLPVAATSVAYCKVGRHYSHWPSRPERLATRRSP